MINVKVLKTRLRKIRLMLQKHLPILQLNKEEMINALKRQNITNGSHIMVHVSLYKMGYVKGGAPNVVEALKQAVGPDGYLMMPAYSALGRTYDYVMKHRDFDVVNTPTKLGAIPEAFRTSNGVYRTPHPTHSVCLWGKCAEQLVKDERHHMDPFWNNAYEYMLNNNAYVLLIGVDFESMSIMRMLDDIEPQSGVNPYLDKEFTFEVRDYNGQIREVNSKVHDPAISKKRRNSLLYPIMQKRGLIKTFKLGNARCTLVKMVDVLNTRRQCDQDGIYTFLPTRQDED